MLDVFNTFSYYVLSFLKRLARVSEFDNKVLLNQNQIKNQSTSELHEEHLFAGRNTQHRCVKIKII